MFLTPMTNDQHHVWRLDPVHGAKLIGTVTLPNHNDGKFSSDGTRIAYTYRTTSNRIFMERYDGASWAAPVEITGVSAFGYREQSLNAAVMDASGTVHATGYAFDNASVMSMVYIRAPVGQPIAVTQLPGSQGNWAPLVAVSGSRVAIAVNYMVPSGTNSQIAVNDIRESDDGGVFFGAHRILGRTTSGPLLGFSNAALALLPGRHVWLGAQAPTDLGGIFSGGILFDPLEAPVVGQVIVDPPAPTPTPPAASPPPISPTTPTTSPTSSTPPPATPTMATNTTPPVSTTPTTPTSSPAQQEPVLIVDPASIDISAGGSATVQLIFGNPQANMIGSEAPTFTGLPTGVTATTGEVGWRAVAQGSAYNYTVTLRAEASAPNATNSLVAHVRWATDRPALATSVLVRVYGNAALAAPTPDDGAGAFQVSQVAPGVYVMVGTGAMAGLVVVLSRTDAGKWIVGAAALPLYTRLTRADVLAHEVRAGIHAHISANPGARLSEIATALEISTSPLVHHLRVLEREGYLSVNREWSRRRYYATGSIPIEVRAGAKDVTATLTKILEHEPGLSPAAVAARLDISRQLARYHLRALERSGIVRAQGEGISRGYVLVVRR